LVQLILLLLTWLIFNIIDDFTKNIVVEINKLIFLFFPIKYHLGGHILLNHF